jgi:Tol biopolymer transport system component
MRFSEGARLGPFSILGSLGAGGMGEVYRARDTRLGREVALKVLHADRSSDAEDLKRLEGEARAVSSLNHPNILSLHEVGTHEGVYYIVTELLEGQTLRGLLKHGGPAPRQAVDYAIQIARGLAAAHERGIIHRDLKPENVFVTHDGRVKVLDFGLAKARPATDGEQSGEDATATGAAPGVLMGTASYMSPEQVRGDRLEPASDLFALGAVLYEMLSRRRAFHGETTAETLVSVLKEDPPDLGALDGRVPPSVARIVRRCLEKNPGERFRSAHDLALALEAASGDAAPRNPNGAPRRSAVLPALAAVALASAALWWWRPQPGLPASYKQLTFRNGTVGSAKFTPDGNSVLYAASWDGRASEVFSMRLDAVEPRALGLPATFVAGVAKGQMALVRRAEGGTPGSLAQVSLDGGTPRPILQGVVAANWSRDGSRFAVVRVNGDRQRLEYPAGTLIFESSGGVNFPKISPDGERVAFFAMKTSSDVRGALMVATRDGHVRVLSDGWSGAGFIAWSPDGRELWFSASREGAAHAVHAVGEDGHVRLLARVPGRLLIQDVLPDGRALMIHRRHRIVIRGAFQDAAGEGDLSWSGSAQGIDLSADGRTLLFSDFGQPSGPRYGAYLRKTDGSPAMRLGDGYATGLSPDGQWALSMLPTSPSRLLLLPTGAGEPITLDRGTIEEYTYALWFPDGQRVLIEGHEPGRSSRLFVQDLGGGPPRAVLPEGVVLGAARSNTIHPDGRSVVATAADNETHFALYPLDGGPPQPLAGLLPGDEPLRWAADGDTLFVWEGGPLPAQVRRLDVVTGTRVPWKTMGPTDLTGVRGLMTILLSADGQKYCYQYERAIDDLYLVEGLR